MIHQESVCLNHRCSMDFATCIEALGVVLLRGTTLVAILNK